MIQIKLGLSKLTRTEKVNQGTSVKNAVTGNGNFPSTETAALLADLNTKTTALATANAATGGGSREAFAAARQKEAEYEVSIKQMAAYVQGKANTETNRAEEIILSADFRTRRVPERSELPGQVEGILARTGNTTNSIIVRWNKVRFARIYELEMTTTPSQSNSWAVVSTAASRRIEIFSLTAGTQYFFRARAVGIKGRGEYSIVISQFAA